MDIEVHSAPSSEEMKKKLNDTMVEGFTVLSCRRLPEGAGNAMSLVAVSYTHLISPEERPSALPWPGPS